MTPPTDDEVSVDGDVLTDGDASGVDDTSLADNVPAVARLAGPIGAAFTSASILAAALLSPTFSWTQSALSDLGAASDPLVSLLFNGGLIAGGLVGAAYALALRPHSTVLAVGYVFSILAMALVGVFPAGTGPHMPVAIAFFLLATATVTLDGWRRRASTTGRVGLALAGGHIAGWLLWSAGIRPGPGLALPELGGVVMFGAWLLALSPPSQWWWRRRWQG
ncbi:DUF998 domain-containing protein [Halobellus captivus]|uniref:DUF998 domain-containing protein n=1 Tax=Halobellus captivus TaxID=2592614 RepID=UPI00119DAACF|nr:DUF998 domain-containing protein [Halobellus captivus]